MPKFEYYFPDDDQTEADWQDVVSHSPITAAVEAVYEKHRHVAEQPAKVVVMVRTKAKSVSDTAGYYHTVPAGEYVKFVVELCLTRDGVGRYHTMSVRSFDKGEAP